MKKIAIIPARGGSKRIPRKNIKSFDGKPIIAYSIQAALESGVFDKVMVSTDDEEIARISRSFGAEVPFFRSVANSDDYSGPGDVVAEVLALYHQMNESFAIACCIYATAPLVTPEKLIQALQLLENSPFDAVFPVARFCAPIWRSFKVASDGGVTMNFPKFERYRSQDLPQAFYDAGQFYWFYTDNLSKLSNKNSFGTSKGMIVLEDFEVQDIDEPSDWMIAELKYEYLKSKSI